jgi:hypothetical protein
MFALMLIGYIALKIYYPNESFKEGDYGKKAKAIHIFKWVIAICFIVVNVISLFIDFQYYWPKFLTVTINLLSAGITVYDIFYKQILKEEYTIALQERLLNEIPFDDIFVHEENVADYNLKGNDVSMTYKVIKGERGYVLGKKVGETNFILRPKSEMTENEIKFFAKQINFFWTENARLPESLKMFENRELYDQIDEYIWIKSPKIRILFNKKFQEKLAIILFYSCLGVLVAVAKYEEYASYFAKAYETIIEWVKGIIK